MIKKYYYADKKSNRITSEGIVLVQKQEDLAAIVEINCETDFVSKNDDFKEFAQLVIDTILKTRPTCLEDLLETELNSKTIEETRNDLIVKIGENINIRRFDLYENVTCNNFGIYSHGNRIGCLVQMKGGNPELARNIAMHITAFSPLYISENKIPLEEIISKRNIFSIDASGKPSNIVEKIVNGRMDKFLDETCLERQNFLKNPDNIVRQILEQNVAEVLQFVRMEVGEGIEKKVENFSEEVMSYINK